MCRQEETRMLFYLKFCLEAPTRLEGAEKLLSHTLTIFSICVQESRWPGVVHLWTILGSWLGTSVAIWLALTLVLQHPVPHLCCQTRLQTNLSMCWVSWDEKRGEAGKSASEVLLRCGTLAGRSVCKEQWCWEIFWDQSLLFSSSVLPINYQFAVKGLCPGDKLPPHNFCLQKPQHLYLDGEWLNFIFVTPK